MKLTAPHPRPVSRWERGSILSIGLILFCLPPARADKVITKDGKIYTGKILIDSDKAVLIGNPPFDPNSTLIKAEDIQTIVYEEYHPNAPAERRRGVSFDLGLQGDAFSSSELSMSPAAGLRLGGGFRFHPLIEIGGGLQWIPSLSTSGDDFTVASSTSPGGTSRGYDSFWQYALDINAKIYPFYQKTKWKTEPYLMTGYSWSHLIPKASGDSLTGSGWLLGAGAIRPITEHVFLEGRFLYQNTSFNRINFLGTEGDLSPEITQHQYTLSLGLSYRI